MFIGFLLYILSIHIIDSVKKEMKQLEQPKNITVAELFENQWREEELKKTRTAISNCKAYNSNQGIEINEN